MIIPHMVTEQQLNYSTKNCLVRMVMVTGEICMARTFGGHAGRYVDGGGVRTVQARCCLAGHGQAGSGSERGKFST
ncbi:hypothetical protein [Janthinobacterium sp. RB2R34]|uniref:hypothetical protein n=1 Tax=Janthinobacterium sp. RB2R34 TaxID=3424193 RepID=UPI003F26F953